MSPADAVVLTLIAAVAALLLLVIAGWAWRSRP